MKEYPAEFLGRCSTCLDNAIMNRKPCPTGPNNGQPRRDDECLIYLARQQYDREQAPANTGGE